MSISPPVAREQNEDPVNELVPVGQEEHEVAPDEVEYVPAEHGTHTDSLVPRVPEKLVPKGHFRHTGKPKPEYVPGPHGTQSPTEFAPGPT